jgi:cytidylate kinase
MRNLSESETRAYLAPVDRRHQDRVGSRIMGYSVVCISSTDGASAQAVAGAVSGQLGFPVVNEQIIERAAIEAGVDRDVIADLERRKTALQKILNRFSLPASANPDLLMSADDPVTAGTLGTSLSASATSSRLTPDEMRGLIRSAIDEFAARGDVIIVAHAASQALGGRTGVLRVLVTASPDTRSARLAESLGVDAKAAEQTVKKGDAGRAAYLQKFYGIDSEPATLYDLVVNTDDLSPEQAAASIVGVATHAPTSA